ncbi:MAG: hypothetical protein EHM28_08880 [Spirochaetaceae bacterium]|nr:MAG: hypothetical protein EHM28_08880 [Spirochaetaceae bacterium]
MNNVRFSETRFIDRLLPVVFAISTFAGLFYGCGSYDTNEAIFTQAHLEGMIYDNHNNPCAGARISADNGPAFVSDVNGRFTLYNLSRGIHEIAVVKKEYETSSFSVEFLSRTQVLYVKMFSQSQLLELAETALDGRKLGEADEFLKRAEAIDKEVPVLLYLKSVLELKRDNYDDALSLLKQLVQMGYTFPPVFLSMADIYEYKLKDIPNAISALKNYLNLVENPAVRERLSHLETGN